MRTNKSCRQIIGRAPRALLGGLCCFLSVACGSGGSSDPAGGGAGNSGGSGDGGSATGGSSGSGGASGGSGGIAGMAPEFPEPTKIATDGSLTCALAGTTVQCWGTDYMGMSATVQALTDVAALAQSGIVALSFAGVAYGLDGLASPYSWAPLLSDAPVRHVKYSFIFLEDGTAQWMTRDGELESPFTEPLVDAASNAIAACGIRKADQTIVCLPPYPDMSCGLPASQYAAPSGTFASITANFYHLCALGTDGTLTCWGAGTTQPGEPDEPLCVSEGLNLTQGQDAPPPGTFRYVSAGVLHTCGVRTDGTIACWGAGTTDDACDTADLDCGQSMAPSDADFVQVAAGFTHSCGLKESGKVVCWGSDTGGKSTPPQELQP